MNSQRPFEDLLSDWIEDGPTDAPDQLLETVRAAFPSIDQRRGFGPPWRTSPMYRPFRLAFAAVAAIVLVGGGFLLLRPSAQVGSAPAPATASPSACVTTMTTGDAISRVECRYVSGTFRPQVSFQGDPAWTPGDESNRGLSLTAAGLQNPEGIALVTIDRLAVAPCQKTDTMANSTTVPFRPKTAASGPAELFNWIHTKTSLVVPTPTPVTIAGFAGLATTVTLSDSALADCNGIVWLTWVDPGTAGGTGQMGLVLSGLSWRLVALDVNGTTVLIETWAPSDAFATFEPEAETLLAGMRFQ